LVAEESKGLELDRAGARSYFYLSGA
jgi:hypothetical protein